MIEDLYKYRFQLYFISQLSIIFGTLVLPVGLFHDVLLPIFLLVNILIGVLVVSKQKYIIKFYLAVFIASKQH